MLHAYINGKMSTSSVVAGAVTERSDALGVGVGTCLGNAPPCGQRLADSLAGPLGRRTMHVFYHAHPKRPSVPHYAPTDPTGPCPVHAGTRRQGSPARRRERGVSRHMPLFM
jgi:hypothetical protein